MTKRKYTKRKFKDSPKKSVETKEISGTVEYVIGTTARFANRIGGMIDPAHDNIVSATAKRLEIKLSETETPFTFLGSSPILEGYEVTLGLEKEKVLYVKFGRRIDYREGYFPPRVDEEG